MPATVNNAPDYIPEAMKKQWADIWNEVYDKQKKDGKSDKDAEAAAFAQANGVIKKEKKQMPQAKREVRFLAGCEMRAMDSAEGMKIAGYAAMWDSPTVIRGFFGDGFNEQIRKGAFSRALAEKQDVRALFNHGPNGIVGRTVNNTLRLAEDDRGLRYEVDLPDTQTGRDLYTLVKRGDISQSSFGFSVYRDENRQGEEWFEPESGIPTRTLTDVDLFDVSPVTFPAYNSTSVSARSLWPDGVPEEIEARATTKKEEDGEYPAGDYLVVEDPKKVTTWHLQVKKHGKPDHGLMGAAWAALHEGHMGNKYAGPNKQEALDKLKALYKSEKMDLPEMKSLVTDAEDAAARNELMRQQAIASC